MKATLAFLIASALLIAGCAILRAPDDASARSTDPRQATAADTAISFKAVNAAANPPASCVPPAGWVAYQLRVNETVYTLAARANIDPAALLSGNCQASAAALVAGQWFYVPPAAASSPPGTLLPLAINALTTYPATVGAGEPITLYWHAQGPVLSVRAGWVESGQFLEAARGLPAGGSWTFTAPDDGRTEFTLMVRANDGVSEVAAQTTITLRCGESWFFSPAQSGCPRPPLVTAFVAQSFERGRIVSVPALKTHFVFADGQPARQIAENAYALAVHTDPALVAGLPAGLRAPQGALAALWHGNVGLRTALGWATGDAQRFSGLLQRTGSAASETLYFSLGIGQVYRFQVGGAWHVLVTQ